MIKGLITKVISSFLVTCLMLSWGWGNQEVENHQNFKMLPFDNTAAALAAFKAKAPELGIDITDPDVYQQLEVALNKLRDQYLKHDKNISPTNPSAFAALIADSLKKIKALELEILDLTEATNPYRSGDDEKKLNLQAELKIKNEILADEMFKLHVYLKNSSQQPPALADGLLKKINVVFVTAALIYSSQFAKVLHSKSLATAYNAVFLGSVLVWLGLNAYNAIATNPEYRILFKDRFSPRDQTKYLAQVQKELKKMLEPDEQLVAEQVLAYVSNYGCNAIVESITAQPKPKFRVAPEKTPATGKTNYRIEAGGTTTQAEIDAAEAAELEQQKLKYKQKQKQ